MSHIYACIRNELSPAGGGSLLLIGYRSPPPWKTRQQYYFRVADSCERFNGSERGIKRPPRGSAITAVAGIDDPWRKSLLSEFYVRIRKDILWII